MYTSMQQEVYSVYSLPIVSWCKKYSQIVKYHVYKCDILIYIQNKSSQVHYYKIKRLAILESLFYCVTRVIY